MFMGRISFIRTHFNINYQMDYQKIIEFQSSDLTWDFDDKLPYFKVPNVSRSWPDSIKVDPFPCGKHNVEIAKPLIERIESIFPTKAILKWVFIPCETAGRTNAWASYTGLWKEELKKEHKIECIITLSGKRPIVHPHMTKYLVAHEYGHIVDYWISACMKEEKGENCNDENLFRKLYSEVRGVPDNDSDYGGGRWVNNIKEIIADDFRIVLGQTDTDFYLHNSCEHPMMCPNIIEFWHEMRKKYATY